MAEELIRHYEASEGGVAPEMSKVIIPKQCKIYEFSPSTKPAVYCNPGDTVVFETTEAPDGQIRSEEDWRLELDKNRGNPTTGPVHVARSARGDTLAILVKSITLDGPGYLCLHPSIGLLRETVDRRSIKIVSIEDGAVKVGGMKVPIRPMIGVIGTTPEQPVRTTEFGPFGGNMDNRQITEGTCVFLPVFVDGALLGIGDLHASMGDGEISGSGIEIAGKAKVVVNVLRGVSFGFPVVETETEIMCAGEGEMLIDAVKLACRRAHSFLVEYCGMSNRDAHMFLAAFGHVKVSQCAFCDCTDDYRGLTNAAARLAIDKETGIPSVHKLVGV